MQPSSDTRTQTRMDSKSELSGKTGGEGEHACHVSSTNSTSIMRTMDTTTRMSRSLPSFFGINACIFFFSVLSAVAVESTCPSRSPTMAACCASSSFIAPLIDFRFPTAECSPSSTSSCSACSCCCTCCCVSISSMCCAPSAAPRAEAFPLLLPPALRAGALASRLSRSSSPAPGLEQGEPPGLLPEVELSQTASSARCTETTAREVFINACLACSSVSSIGKRPRSASTLASASSISFRSISMPLSRAQSCERT
mmetsp:Transcript_51820/g.119130  ORF Transcript_51820/g.119130 Transcript_51820/m.119130 type:complete len:255 (+) Transcript_51820:71-835(+)